MSLPPIGSWSALAAAPAFDAEGVRIAAHRFREPAVVIQEGPAGRVGVGFDGRIGPEGGGQLPLLAALPPLYPEWLGDRGFNEVHGTRFPYVMGAMANGIATARLVIEAARAGMLGFFGAAGLSRQRVEQGLDEIQGALGEGGPSYGSNLIHSPNEPALEAAVVDLYLRRRVRRVSASAYMALTPMIVRYAATGLSQGPDGQIHRLNHVFAKISHPDVARRFLMPAPAAMLAALVQRGELTAEEARLAASVPVAEDFTVESDSGGHTDNRPLGALFPTIVALRDEIAREQSYTRPIRVGAAGGIGTPTAAAAAFQLGAAFILTGSVNQSAVESGLSEVGRKMLCTAKLDDVIMAPAADMFEQGVKVQVLKRGTMFAGRAARLYEAYIGHPSLEAIPAADRARLETQVLGRKIDEIWAECEAFWGARDPHELGRAQADPKHRMALVFRWYLGRSSRWAIDGESSRALDYQVWCGPAMGAFNAWVKGSFLEPPEARTVVQIARNLLEGAAVVTRAHQLKSYGVAVPAAAFDFRPRPLA